ncbi:phosphoadenosine phosphosulfate reductase family protein [Shimia thalassica]|uniref:phosphoadenosine phosphosulfate reductase family protein n=1 Tax=Shimia thalassica TaxID=1715693 RepID=UPI002732445C|nr:phosphoadenosine phosphosulfate reductase family protein [Shimia thalassica]MDP2495533.1 phosphoadenosine phosphosulfate reductase family protein [Shimia thalassica]
MKPATIREASQDFNRRHIVPLSGGKDSTALAVYMLENHNDLPLEFLFTDTGAELPETYAYINRFEAIFGVEVNRMTALDLPELQVRSKNGRRSPFDVLLDEVYSGFLPNPQARWCTRMLKIRPFEHFVGDDECYSYIGIRADENREGFGGGAVNHTSEYAANRVSKPVALSSKDSIRPVYPLKDAGIGIDDVRAILEESGLGFPEYYRWRSRSGCYFCFYQQVGEWQALMEEHPDLFAQAASYEDPKSDGRQFSWTQRRTLSQLAKLKKRYDAPTGEPEDGCAICHL